MKRALLTAYCIVLTACAAHAINGTSFDPSRELFSARQLGMGNVSLCYANDASGVFSNPSGLVGFEFPQLTTSSRKIT
ncbi:MAG: hypothetical protein PHG97_05035, partial [Candidatus Margulisbacteria bacterium]|nr:hypothetical protein [Candidatus Margulisiibacteriota bacterium]